MLELVLALLCGLLLLGDNIGSSTAVGKAITKLRPFATVVGVVSLIVGLLSLLSITGVLLFLGGWALAADAMGAVPGVGGQLKRWGRRLRRVGWLLGVLLLAAAVLSLFGWLGRPDGVGPPPWRP
ncbi:MAG: hypothetical protein R3191_06005 [Anaerolineales bacterium]|nr:hypothetical protein [Anaerolineales bacterium]